MVDLVSGAKIKVSQPTAVVKIGTAQGPQGLPGRDGTDGAPGGSDQAFHDWIVDGASQTHAALSATFAVRQSGLELSDVFTGKPDGAPTKTLTGQAYSLYSATAPNGYPTISGGYLTFANTDYLGGYATAKLDGDVLRLGASFAFTSWTNGGGLAALAVTENDIKATQNAGQGLPRIPIHFVISPESWSLGYCPTVGGSVTNVRSGVFETNLTADGATLHHAEVIRDTSSGTVYLTLPDGQQHVVQNDNFKIPGAYAFIEPYRDTQDTSKTKPLFAAWWADSRNRDLIPARRAEGKQTGRRVRFAENMPGAAANLTLTTSQQQVTGVSQGYIVPDSGTVMVTLEALVDQTADGPVHFGILDGSNSLVAVRTVSTKVSNGRRILRLPLTQGNPGEQATAKFCAYLGGTAAATVLLGNDGTTYAGASISVQEM